MVVGSNPIGGTILLLSINGRSSLWYCEDSSSILLRSSTFNCMLNGVLVARQVWLPGGVGSNPTGHTYFCTVRYSVTDSIPGGKLGGIGSNPIDVHILSSCSSVWPERSVWVRKAGSSNLSS